MDIAIFSSQELPFVLRSLMAVTADPQALTHYNLPTAKSFGKWFCRHCGCPVPRLTRNSKMMVIPAGSLDTAPPIAPTDHIFWASRAPWGCASGGLPTHTEYPESW